MLFSLGWIASAAQAQEIVQSAVNVDDEQVLVTSEENAPAEAWQFKPRWRLQYDVAEIDGPAGLPGDGSFSAIRRIRMGVDISMPSSFSSRIDVELQDDSPQIIDAYLMWKKNDMFVMAGQQKAVNPLDLHGSNLNISFMERPAFYNTFNYGRGTGIMAGYESDAFGFYGGVFTDNLVLLNDVKKNSLFVDFRTYVSPQLGDVRLHLAGSYHARDLGDFAKTSTRYRQRPFLRITDERYIGTPGLMVQKETRYGLEGAVSWERFHLAGEVHWLEADRTGATDPRFFGAYGEIGFFLTKDSRPLKSGVFGAIKPKKPLDGGGIGAVQFNLRYDYLDLNSGGIVGGKQNGYMASLVWTPVEFLRLMINYAQLDYSDANVAVAGSRDYSVDVFGLRGQIHY